MRIRLMSSLVVVVTLLSCASLLADDQPTVLDNDSIVQMVEWHIKDAAIVAAIGRNQTNFDLSPSTIKLLQASGVSGAVIDSMFAATKKASKASASAIMPSAAGIKPNPGAANPGAATSTVIPAHTPQRLAEASGASAVTPAIVPFHMPCPLARNGKFPKRTISLYFLSGTSDPTRVDDPGAVCFEVNDFNDILYTPSFTLTETAPTDSALSLLQDAIKTVTGFSFGGTTTDNSAAAAKNAANAANAAKGIAPAKPPAQCPTELVNAITTAQGAAGRFGDALSQIDPGKDSSGNINLVDWRTTRAKWQPVPEAYQQFEAAVSNVISDLQLSNVDVCTNDVKAAAEAVIIDTYLGTATSPGARTTFTALASHVASDHVVRFTSDVHPTSTYTAKVTANYPAGSLANGSVTFSLAAGRTILSSSGGFLVTEVPSPSYSSVTAPSGMTTPATQNVLAVNNPNGPSVGLTALLNVYLPSIYSSDGSKILPLNGHAWGLALSVGPTYNLSNGKADTSKFGLFAGLSVHIRNQFFLTPGVNLGQYSNWPVGFSKAGQVIPANVGTPTGVSRWTTRFAFALTYKIKDFGQSTTPTPLTPATTTPGTTTTTKKTAANNPPASTP